MTDKMKRLTKVIKWGLPLFFFSLQLFSQPKEIKDIIAPIKVISGRTDSIIVSDLFYLPEYSITFIQGKNIVTEFNKEKKLLIIKTNPDFEGVSTIDFLYNNKINSIPIYGKKLSSLKFSFKPKKKYKAINLFGSFNNWDRKSLPLTDAGNGNYEITIPLEPGRYEYKFFADGEELNDPLNKETIANGIGGINSLVTIPNLHDEKIFLHKAGFANNSTGTEFQFYLEKGKPVTIYSSNLIVLIDNKRISENSIAIDGSLIKINLSKSDLAKAKMLRAVIDINGLVSNIQMISLSNGKPNDNSSPFNWYDASIYSVMTDRFNNGNKKNDSPVKHDSLSWKANYNGGDFAGITQKIKEGYFNSLGVNALWISPVNDNTDVAFKEYPAPHRWFTGYHGYWPISENKVEEKFGSFSDLKNLIATAHKHGMKVLLDFVSHHVHQEHPFYKNHPEWFGILKLPDGRLNLRMWDEYRLTTWFEPYMPSFDFEKSDEATEVMSDNAIWWLKKTGADGFRHDAVKHVPNKFWRALTTKLKKEIEIPNNKQVYQIGETFGNYDLVNSYVSNGQLSAQFNFEQYNSAQAVFIDSTRSFKDLDSEMKKGIDVFGSLNLMGNIMDSHDKNRYMAYADGDLDLSQWSATEIGWNNPPNVDHLSSYDKAELYYAYMFTVPGLPVIYYGSEFGMTGASDPDNRRMMRFGNNLKDPEKKMLDVVSGIVKLRSENSALRYGDYYPLLADTKMFAYVRSDFYERIVTVLNKTSQVQEVSFKLPEIYKSQSAINLTDNVTYKVANNKIRLSVKPRGWMILKLN
jgi:cyclomaltodextrinase / maltogenic alpha-amylase / neopullulanase